jgi:Xaa-Pro aminopeptidase
MTSPFDAAHFARRIAAGRAVLAQENLGALVLWSAPRGLAAATRTSGNVGWFTGFTPMWAPSCLLITPESATIIAPGKNELRLFRTRVGESFTILDAGPPGLVAALTPLLPQGPVGIAGMAEMPHQQATALLAALPRPVPIDGILDRLRMTRDASEIALHRRAADISDSMVAQAFAAAGTPHTTPAQLMAAVEHEGRMEGADVSRLWLSTGPLPPVTFFEMFELPPSLSVGDRVQLGTMVSYEGYFAQTLRIGALGPAAPALGDAVRAIEDIQDEALALLRPGEPVHRLVDLIEARIDGICPFTRDSDPFRFQSCHGMGLDYGEPGLADALSPRRDKSRDAQGIVLAPGMIFEIHPNFTLPGVGHVCAGDVALVTETGAKWLTHAPRGVARI